MSVAPWSRLCVLWWLGWLCLSMGCTPVGEKACERDEQCVIGKYCDPKDNRCKEGCKNDARCPAGQTCYADLCKPKICEPGSKVACYTGDASTRGRGSCQDGFRYCVRNGQAQTDCLGEIKPIDEVCDGVDNDCDGEIDEGLGDACRCNPGRSRLCYTGPTETQPKPSTKFSVCRQGVQYCSLQGTWGPCLGQILPTTEFCNRNGRDDNCNEDVDEKNGLAKKNKENGYPCCKQGDTQSCWIGSRKTNKNQGTQKCIQSSEGWWVWGPCEVPGLKKDDSCSVEELGGRIYVTNVYDIACNGKDDDCDGTPDNRFDTPTQTISKVCAPVNASCQGKQPDSLVCLGTCQLGLEQCKDGDWTQSCEGAVGPEIEVCNGKDDNCDGAIDNLEKQERCFDGQQGCTKQPDGTYQCVGSCRAGLLQCNDGKATCVDQILPKEESQQAGTCNDGLDNDCDGKKDINDPDCPCGAGDTRPCYTAMAGCTQQSDGTYQCVGACKTGVQRCDSGKWGACENEVTPRKTEFCGNQQDDNCNGVPDEKEAICQCNPGTRPCYSGPDGTAGVGSCKVGEQTCQNNRVWGPCLQEVTPRQEDCSNQEDDNCDGSINENCP